MGDGVDTPETVMTTKAPAVLPRQSNEDGFISYCRMCESDLWFQQKWLHPIFFVAQIITRVSENLEQTLMLFDLSKILIGKIICRWIRF